jgi:two-component system sensor histidine kinase KdpD
MSSRSPASQGVRTPQLLGPRRPPRALGAVVAVAGVAAATAIVYPLKDVAPVVSLGVVYLLAVVVVALFWGLVLGIATSVLSIVAFGFFHLPPPGHFTVADERDWVGLAVFAAVATITGLVAELARTRQREADQRRREADLAAELARLLLGATRLEDALPLAAGRVADAVGVAEGAIELGEVAPAPGTFGLALCDAGRPVATLLLPATLPDGERAWVRDRVVPALESILAAALHRAQLQAEVVETAALRRSDEMKTAVLRSVSHDLRTPVTAILSAAGTLDPDAPTRANVAEVRELVTEAGRRLWRLIEKLLDLSLLQAGRLSPGVGWCSIEEVLREAVAHTGREDEIFALSIDPNLPLLQGDPAQLERAFANVLENAARYRGDGPVSVRARAVGERVRVLVVDQGPGIAPAEQERVFMPFYRVGAGGPPEPGQAAHHGSGLGLAIAKGFVEVNGGRIAIESVPGQGTTVVIEFPLPQRSAGAQTPAQDTPLVADGPAQRGGR